MEKTQKHFYKKWWFIIIILLVIGTAVVATITLMKKKNTLTSSTSEGSGQVIVTGEENFAPSQDSSKVTYENFMKINLGMSYDDVVSILGEGKQTGSMDALGIKSVMFSWDGAASYSSIRMTVRNGVVAVKSQSGLQEVNTPISLDKYNQITEGMLYDDVKAILGEGQIEEQADNIMDITITYAYRNEDDSYAKFKFDSNGLAYKTQDKLK